MYGYGYRFDNKIVIGAAGGAPFVNTKSLLFDGTDDYVSTGINTGANDVTVSCWIKTTETFVYTLSRLAFGGSGSGGGNFTLGRLGSAWNSADDMKIRVYNTLGTTKLNDGNWHHVAYTFDNTTKEMKGYVDGSLEATTTVTSWVHSFVLQIGGRISMYFNGNVDECGLWYSILTASEINDIYNSGVPTDLTSLSPIGWWRNGDNDTYPTITDHGSGGNDGTMTNMTSGDIVTDVPPSTWVNTKSLLFDGTDDYVDLGTTINLGINSTVSFWLKRNAVNVASVLLGENTYSFDYLLYVETSKKLYFRIGGVYAEFGSAGVISIMDDTINWINIVIVRSGDVVELFLNGASMGTASGFGTIVNTRFDAIGAKFNSALSTNGNIDEVAAWNVNTISPSDIYNGGTPNNLNDLATVPTNYWRMGDGATFPTIPDVGSLASNDGTMTNMTSGDIVTDTP